MKLPSVAVGIAAFLVPQVVLFFTAPESVLRITAPGRFLNSGANLAIISSVLVVLAALVAVRPQWTIADTALFGFGVLIAMVVTLFAIGPGTLFPIVVVVGAVAVAVAILVGTAVGYSIRLAAMRMALWR